MSESETHPQNLSTSADRALFSGQVRGFAVILHRNERPLSGLAGLLDWRFQGAVSSYVRNGAISGELGQCAYLPLTRKGVTYHLLFIGAGDCVAPGKRVPPPTEALAVMRKNILGLRLEKIGLSRSDLGGVSDEFLVKHLEGIPLWIVQ